MVASLHKVLRQSYIGIAMHEPGAVVTHDEDSAGDNLKKLTADEVRKHKAKLADEEPDPDLPMTATS